MYSEEIRSSELAKKLLIFDLVYLDTCSLMDDSFPLFMDLLVKSRYYWKKKVTIKVLPEVYAELTKHASNEEKAHLRVSAARAIKILKHDSLRLWNRTITVDKSKDNDGFADNAIFTEVSTWRIKKKVLVITQDKKLTTDLKKQNSLDSARGRFVLVYRINSKGELEENIGEIDNSSKFKKPNGISSATPNAKSSKPQQKPQPAPVKEETAKPNPVLQQISTNDKRIAANLNNKNYPLEKKIADLEAQIELISNCDKKSVDSISLSYPISRLKDSLSNLKKPAKTQEIAKKPAEKKENQKKAEVESQPKIWFEFGSDPFEAAIRACTAKSIIPHRKDIAYSKAGHGEANVTIEELADRLSKAKFEKVGDVAELRFQNHVLYVEKTDKDFKAHIELLPPAPKTKKAPKQNNKPAKVEEPKPEEISAQETGVEEPTPVPSPIAVEEVKVEEPTPVVEEKPAEEVKIVEEPAPVKKEAPKKQSKPKAKKAPKTEKAPKEEAPKEENAKEDEPKKVSPELAEALEAERVLKCNVQNPNYAKKNKIKALEAQLEKAHALKESDRRKLSWGIRELQKRLSELTKEEK